MGTHYSSSFGVGVRGWKRALILVLKNGQRSSLVVMLIAIPRRNEKQKVEIMVAIILSWKNLRIQIVSRPISSVFITYLFNSRLQLSPPQAVIIWLRWKRIPCASNLRALSASQKPTLGLCISNVIGYSFPRYLSMPSKLCSHSRPSQNFATLVVQSEGFSTLLKQLIGKLGNTVSRNAFSLLLFSRILSNSLTLLRYFYMERVTSLKVERQLRMRSEFLASMRRLIDPQKANQSAWLAVGVNLGLEAIIKKI